MAFDRNDPLNPDPEAGLVESGNGLFKTAQEAYRQDVVPAAHPQQQRMGLAGPGVAVAQAQTGSLADMLGIASAGGAAPKQSGPATLADVLGLGAPVQEEAPKAEKGNFSRGLEVSGKQLKQTAYGTAALIGDTVGADSLKEWGLKGYQEAEKEVRAISKESDSFTNAVQSGEIGKWLSYSSGYLLGQVAELGVASIAGAALGTLAAPGGGTVAGAAAGAIEKGAVEAGIRGFVGKMIDKQVTANVARGMSQEAAAQAAVKSVYGTIGATTANTFLNATQELGSIYGDAVEEAALTGKEYSLGRVWLSGIAATAVDSWADSKALGNLVGAATGGKKFSGIAMEALKGGFREGMTEGIQTAIERWGADKDVASKEAFKEYIDSAAVGILGGSVSGAGAGAINKLTAPSDKPKADTKLTEEDISTEGATDKAQVKLEAPVALDREELLSILRKPEAMAYLYQNADDAQKANIEKAVEKAGASEAFNAAKGQMDAIQSGEKIFQEFPEYQQALEGAIAGYAKKPNLNVNKGNTLEAPPSQFDAMETQPASTKTNTVQGPEGFPEPYESPESIALARKEQQEQLDREQRAIDEHNASLQSQTRIDAPTQEKLEGRKQDSSMGPSDPVDLSKLEQAKREFKDAAAQALDVVMDVTGSKLNITGKQYTVKDLPGAIQRVMEALVKMGYYKLEEISAQVMARMKANDNWKGLADKVTPNMLRMAYMKLQFPEKQSPAEVNGVKTDALQGIIAKQYAYEPAQQQAPVASEMGKATGNMKGAQAETTIDSNMEEPGDKGVAADEIEYDKYIAKPKKVRTPIKTSKMTPALREYVGSLRPAQQKEALLNLGSMSDAELARFEKDVVAIKQREQERKDEATRGATGALDLEQEAEKPVAGIDDFRRKVDNIVSMRAETQFFRDTLAKMQAALDEIDKSLRGNRTFEENGKVYEAVDEADENAYIWANMGMGKDLPQEKLMAVRRKLMEDIREMQSRSVRGQAQLFKNSLKRIEYDLSIARAKALQAGLPMDEVDKIYEPARQSVVTMMRDLKGKDKVEESIPEEMRGPLADAVQGDFFETDKAVRNLVAGIKDGSISATDANVAAVRGIRNGDFTYGELLSVLRENGVALPHNIIAMSGHVATQQRMLDYVKEHGFNQFFREAWLRSMDHVVTQYPQMLDGDAFTDAEKLAYQEFKDARAKLKSATKVDETMQYSSNAEEAFDGLLFTDYTLGRLRGNGLSTRTAEALKDSYGDPVETWFQHVAFALQTRPDLRNQITEMLKPEDLAEFKTWLQRKEDQILAEAKVNAKAPYFQALSSMQNLSDELFEKIREKLAISQAHEAEKIVANAKRLNDAMGSRKLSESELELIIGDFMDLAKLDGDLELDVDGTMGRESSSLEGVLDLDNVYRRADGEYGYANEAESLEDSDNPEVSNSASDGDPDELRFNRGRFSGVLTAAQVQSVVARITNKWRNAPQITVLQNATMLPEPLRSKVAERTGDLVDAKGLFDSETGQVYLFSDHIGSETDAQFVLFHETYGHYGLRAFLGEKFDAFLEQMYRVYPNVREAADERISGGMPKLEAIDEVLSDMAGMNPDIGPVKSFVARVVVGLREIGLGKVADWIAKISNVELSYYLAGAREAAQNGGYIDNGAPGVIRLAEAVQHERLSEMYSLKGDKTTAFARFNPVTQEWFVYLANGNDVRGLAGMNNTALVTGNYNDVLKLMRSKGHVEFRKRSGVFVQDRGPVNFAKLTEITNLTGMKAWMRSMITKYQNEYRPVFDLVDAIRAKGMLSERMDIKDALLRYERKTGAVVDEFRRRFVRPLESLVNEAGKQGATSKIIDRYLLARHAAERNKQIAKINEQFPDGGSGMMTKTADRYLRQLKKQPYWNTLEEIGRITDQISAKKLKYQLDTGMITAKQYQAFQVYKHYVNLSGRSDLKLDEFDDPMQLAGGGSKFNLKGKEKRALGRKSEATEILSRTILGMEAALIRGQKNQVAQRVLAFFEANYDPNFVTINKIAYKPVIGEDGMVTDKEDDAYIRNPNVMVAKINGIPNTIEFKDTSAGSFAEAIHGVVGMRDNNALLERLGKFNQIVGQMLTTWNPAWGFVNFARDLQTMFFNAAADGRVTKAQAAEMVKTIPSAIKTAYYMARTENLKSTGVNPDPEMVRIYREMKMAGGLTSFLNRKDLESQVADIEALMGERTKLQNAGDKFMKVMDAIEHNFSLPIEIAPRLAAYKVMREAGMSEAQAAQFAGEITVNFNMRGSVKATRQLYLFFNPAVQGSAKLLSLFGTLTPDYKLKFKTKGFAYVGMWVGLGAMMSLIGRALSDDDEAGRNAIDKLPVYKRATSLVFSADVPGAAIPIPYGWNAFYAMGNFMMDSLLGAQPITTSVKRIAQTSFEAFAPLGSAGLDSKSLAGTVLKGVAPTAALPIVEWVMNENRYGAPIRREDSVFGGAKLPDSQMAFRSVNPLSDAAMKGLNEVTGGNKFKSGTLDVNPAAVDFIIGSYMPGFINESYKAAGMAARLSRGEEVKNTPMPLVDRFTAKVPESFDAGAFRRAKEMVETAYNEYKNVPERRDEIRAELPGLMRSHAVVTSVNQQIRELNSKLLKIENSTGFSDDEKVRRLNDTRERVRVLQTKAVKAVMEAGPEFRNAVMASD